MVPTLMAETEKFFDAVAFVKKGTFQDLFLSPVAFVNAATAPLYGLSASGFTSDFKETKLDANQRPGFLTRVGFLNAYAFYNRTSPIHRGAFIMKQVWVRRSRTPPPGAEATALPTASANLDTNRKQVDAQTKGGACAAATTASSTRPASRWRLRRRRDLADEGEDDAASRIDTKVDMMIDGEMVHVTGASRADGEDRRLADGAAALRGAIDLLVYEREGDALDCGTVNDLDREDRARRLHAPQPDHGPHTNSSVPNPSRRGDVMNRRVFLKGVGGAPSPRRSCRRCTRRRRRRGDDGACAAQAPGHLLHAQRLPDHPLVPEGDYVHQRHRRR